MQRSSITHRFLVPLFLALTVMIVSRAVYLNACRIESQALYHALALLAGTVQFASVVLMALVVYPVTYFRGATATERVIASSTNLAVWVVIDTYKVSEAFSCLESIYYGVNIGAILIAWSFAQMGVLELVCRWGKRRRGNRSTILTLVPFVPILLFLLMVCFLSKEGGAAYFNILLDGYVALFRN
ncbi:MAG: hypothetical protein ACWGSD_10980 [Thermodesulfobacteriota bacterium]